MTVALADLTFRLGEIEQLRHSKLTDMLFHLRAYNTVPHAWTDTQDFTRITSGVGEQFDPAHGDPTVGGPHLEGSVVNIERGTTAAPDTTLQTPLKVSRVLQVTDADLVALGAPASTVGDQYLAAIAGLCKGTSLTTVQPIGVLGSGINYGQTDDATLTNTRPDACGVAGYGFTTGPGGGIGGFFQGARFNASGYCGGLEVLVRNNVAGSPVAYDPLNHHSCGVWLVTVGEEDIGTGYLIGHLTGQQFEVGFGILGTVAGGKTGGVRVASFRDDGNAATVFDINGSHTNGLDTSGATFSGNAILMAAAHKVSWGDVGLKRSSAGVLSVTDGAAGSGSIIAANLSGTNTGDQTITLTGDVTGSGTGSFAATIGADKVTYAKMQNVSATDKLLGRSSVGAGDVEEIACTAAGRSMVAAATAGAQRTLLRSYASVRLNATGTGKNYTTATVIADWDTEAADVGGWWTSGSASRLTVPSGVDVVHVGYGMFLSNVAASELVTIELLMNGAITYSPRLLQFSRTTDTFHRINGISGPISVVATDYFEVRVTVTTDTSVDLLGGSGGSFFWIEAC